jgi:hypothetical protein
MRPASLLSIASTQHILNSSRPYRGGNNKLYSFVRENGGWDYMEGQAILTTPNHIIKFLRKNSNYRLDLNKIYKLRSLTQFEIRVQEQAIINYLKPNLNSSHFIIYSFIIWIPTYTPTIKNNIKLKVFNASNGPINNSYILNNIGLITEFDSIGNAATDLGVSKTSISRYINTISSLESPLLELVVFIIDLNRPLTNKTVTFDDTKLFGRTDTRSSQPHISDFDLYSLPIGKLVVLNSEKDPINYYCPALWRSVFKNSAEAALILDKKNRV